MLNGSRCSAHSHVSERDLVHQMCPLAWPNYISICPTSLPFNETSWVSSKLIKFFSLNYTSLFIITNDLYLLDLLDTLLKRFEQASRLALPTITNTNWIEVMVDLQKIKRIVHHWKNENQWSERQILRNTQNLLAILEKRFFS